ncbi:hypothetical protein ILYODFUR_016557 [Ilyodon furcidens]|uniref:Uncharacterized protein n=1 Tax=Ilyodon furcidens TaxID=33524 RepID=A0ABV0T8X1_9TELE
MQNVVAFFSVEEDTNFSVLSSVLNANQPLNVSGPALFSQHYHCGNIVDHRAAPVQRMQYLLNSSSKGKTAVLTMHNHHPSLTIHSEFQGKSKDKTNHVGA